MALEEKIRFQCCFINKRQLAGIITLTARGLRQPTSTQYLILSSTSAAAAARRSNSSRHIFLYTVNISHTAAGDSQNATLGSL